MLKMRILCYGLDKEMVFFLCTILQLNFRSIRKFSFMALEDQLGSQNSLQSDMFQLDINSWWIFWGFGHFWHLIFNIFGIKWVIPATSKNLLCRWMYFKGNKKLKTIQRAIPGCMFWTIWGARNFEVFRGKEFLYGCWNLNIHVT